MDDDGNGLFMEWCDVNGYNTDGIEDELEQDPEDCALIEFDDDFPTNKSGQNRINEIFNIIKYCYENDDAFLNDAIIKDKSPSIDERKTNIIYEDIIYENLISFSVFCNSFNCIKF